MQDISRNAPKYKSVLWGPTCDSNDRICDRELPELEVGDWIYFNEMGSYSYTITTQFNSIERPALYYYIRESKRFEYTSILLGFLCDFLRVTMFLMQLCTVFLTISSNLKLLALKFTQSLKVEL